MTPSSRTDSPLTSSPEGPRVDTGATPSDSFSPRSRKYSTKLACKFCRKKRTKCDGNTPCSHCKAHQKDCIYEKSDQRTKSSLRGEVDSLRRSLHASEAIIEALRHSQLRDRVVQQLQGGATNEQIAEMLHALTAEDSAAPPVAHTGAGGGRLVPGTMSRMPGVERGAPAAIMPGIAPWSDPDEGSELLAAPVCDDATPPSGLFWNPLFAWPVDAGAFLPLDPAVSSLPMQGMGPTGGPLPDVWRS